MVRVCLASISASTVAGRCPLQVGRKLRRGLHARRYSSSNLYRAALMFSAVLGQACFTALAFKKATTIDDLRCVEWQHALSFDFRICMLCMTTPHRTHAWTVLCEARITYRSWQV